MNRTPTRWPLITMRQMAATTFAPDVLSDLLRIHQRHPGGCDEMWLAESYPLKASAGGDARADLIGRYRPQFDEAGIALGYQQGVTLGHSPDADIPAAAAFPEDACQVDVDGRRTSLLCPRNPEALAFEEAYAEDLVRRGRVESFWLDDDLRFGFKSRAESCWCDRCIEALNRRAGTRFGRDEWIARLSSDAPHDPLRAVWAEFKAESLALFASAARRGAKRANPHIRMGYQAISSASVCSGEDFRPVLSALSDGFREPVGIRPGHGFYSEENPRQEIPRKLLDVAREAERCRAIPGWTGSIVYEQENYPHYVMEKSPEAAMKEASLALAAGCDAVSLYWYDAQYPEPLERYEEFVRLAAEWRPYMQRLSDLSRSTHLGGVAHRPDPDIMAGQGNALPASLSAALPRRFAKDVELALLGVPVSIAEAGGCPLYDPASVPEGWFTTGRRAGLLDELDRLPGGPVSVRVDKVHPLVVYPRVAEDGRTVAVTFLNTSIGKAEAMPVRIRRPAGTRASWVRPCASDVPQAVLPGSGDECLVVLPDLAAWEVATLVMG